jgi:hypothetical protein
VNIKTITHATGTYRLKFPLIIATSSTAITPIRALKGLSISKYAFINYTWNIINIYFDLLTNHFMIIHFDYDFKNKIIIV